MAVRGQSPRAGSKWKPAQRLNASQTPGKNPSIEVLLAGSDDKAGLTYGLTATCKSMRAWALACAIISAGRIISTVLG